MTYMAIAQKYLNNKKKVSHKEIIKHVCKVSGGSYESVRGSIIKSHYGILSEPGWRYLDGNLVRCEPGQEGFYVDYDCKEKIKNWKKVKKITGRPEKMVTLGGRDGMCLSIFKPNKSVSFDYSKAVLSDLKKNHPEVETIKGDIFDYSGESDLYNLDLIGYMCGSLYERLKTIRDNRKHKFVVLTIQGQKNFRNHGIFVDWAKKEFKGHEDKVLESMKSAMSGGYNLLYNNFYRRHNNARTMRTTVWGRE